jgi:hypothetical protein
MSRALKPNPRACRVDNRARILLNYPGGESMKAMPPNFVISSTDFRADFHDD